VKKFDVAHIQRQGVNLIIIPLKSSFGHKTMTEQNQTVAVLQSYARAAGLAGTVVPVWDAGSGRMGFLAPSNWRAFFQSIDLIFVARNINRQLICQ
jgi:hypothetical protein